MKKKSQKFREFIMSSNAVNYRDAGIIIEHFNSSVRFYKRFEDVYAAGDEELAAEKLRGAGTYLYQTCEWSLKNYLSRRYDEMYRNCEMTVDEKIKKTDDLSKKNCNLYMLLNEFKEKSIPFYDSVGINCEDILKNAFTINNNPKHNATVPNPTQYKRALGEVRKIIQVYINENAKLEILTDTIYGEENGWYEILEDTNDFSKAYSYILISKKISQINIRGLFSMKWDLVIDMDPATDVSGLAKLFRDYTGGNPWIRLLNNIDSKRKFQNSNITYWVMANGNVDDDNSIVEENKWKARYGRFLEEMLDKYHSAYTKPAKVFIYPIDNEKNLEKMIDAFNTIYEDGEDVDFCVLSSSQEYSKIDVSNFKKSSLEFRDFTENLMVYHEGGRLESMIGKKTIPSLQQEYVDIPESFYEELRDSFEVVYIDIATTEENDAIKTNPREFYQGNVAISWYGIQKNFDVINKDKEIIIDKIKLDMQERGRLLKKVYYEPGIGGTTLLRRIAWELRKLYPTFILEKVNMQTAKNIQKIYDMTHSPIMIFADNNSITIEEVQNLQIELKRMGFAFVICYFERKLKGQVAREGAVYSLVKSFDKSERTQMKDRLQRFITDSRIEDKLSKIVKAERDNEEKLPFIMALYTFDEEFKGVKSYIANFLTMMNEQAQKILFALALADYGNVSMDLQYFVDLFDDESAEEFFIQRAPGINELIKTECIAGKDYVKIKYHLFAVEILRQMSLGREAEEISFTHLVDKILGFIEDSRRNIYLINQDIMSVLRNLFVTRTADVDSEKPAFSPLITKLKEESKAVITSSYDISNDAIIRIFSKLVEVYPEEPHFTAHMARYYFYIERNYAKGFDNINSAIDLSETMNGYIDPLLYHMKAMGYSSRITNTYIKQIYKNMREDNEEENIQIIEQIEEDAGKAFEYFKLVRESNIGIAGHVSEINLCIKISDMAKNTLTETENFVKYITTETGNWVIKYFDRATDLWDECKKLASETNFENLDDIELKLRQLTANLEESISLWENYLKRSFGKNRNQARRLLARAYEKRNVTVIDTEREQENLRRIISLMEENMLEESFQSGNIRIWFDAIKKLNVDNQDAMIMDAIIKLNKWVTLTDSVEAHYYRFILKFIQAIDGSSLAANELPKLLRELKNKSINLYNRTVPQHWLTKSGEGLAALMSNSRSKKNTISEDEMASSMQVLIGRISNNYVNESHAYINYRGVEIYFNPSATKGEIDKSKINQRVKFGVGFSYDGPRAYNSSIKLLGNDEKEDAIRELTYGMSVKCEVIKNILHFVQIRIIGYDVKGSIHISELLPPYSDENRPKVGTVMDIKLLNEKFDNKTQKKLWVATMRNDNVTLDIAESETDIKKALKKIKLQ